MRLDPREGATGPRFFFHPFFGPRFLAAFSSSSGLMLSAIFFRLSCIISSRLR